MSDYNVAPISKEQELEIINLFLNNKISLRAIARKYNRKSYDFVYTILSKYNIDKKRRHIANKILTDDIPKIIQLYQKEHMSARQIAKQYLVSGDVIRRVLIDNGIDIKRHYGQTFDEYYFDNIDAPNKAYLLGFLYADGCVNKNNVISFTVHQNDKEILEMYVSELKATNRITDVKDKPHVRLAFCSKHICDTLMNLGCGRNKTISLKFPDIPKIYKYDFIRGFMDGDGCISVVNRDKHKYISLSFTGTLEMLQELKSTFNVDNKITFYRNSYALHIGKVLDVLRILNNIYNEADLYMTRKYNKYQEYLQWANNKETKDE